MNRLLDKIKNIINKYAPGIIILLWACVQIFLLYKNGIKTDLESVKYIREADNILAIGNVSSPNFWFYSTQVFLIAFFEKIQIGHVGVIVVQMFFSALATYKLFLFLKKRVHPLAAFTAILLLILNIPFNQYSTFLQTESLFHSFTILYIVYLLSVEKINAKNIFFIIAFLAVLTVTRPSGILLYPATIIYIIFWKFKYQNYIVKYLAAFVLSIIALLVLNMGIQSGGELNFLLPFQKEMIICGVPMQDADIKVSSNPNSLAGMLYYVTHNFSQFANLAWRKTISFFGVYRPYYSTINNLYVCGMFLLLYLFSIIGMIKWYRSNKGLLFFCIITIITTWLSVVFSCDDWHNRWLLTLVPVLIILSSKGIERLLR